MQDKIKLARIKALEEERDLLRESLRVAGEEAAALRARLKEANDVADNNRSEAIAHIDYKYRRFALAEYLAKGFFGFVRASRVIDILDGRK